MLVGKKTYYDVLGVTPDVSQVEIKRAYRKLVKNHHPDVADRELTARQRNLANEITRKLNEAYEILKDPKFPTRQAQRRSVNQRLPAIAKHHDLWGCFGSP